MEKCFWTVILFFVLDQIRTLKLEMKLKEEGIEMLNKVCLCSLKY